MTPVDDNETLQIGPDPDKLFVYHRQQLSAMLDGELSPDQGKFMLRRLQHDSELADCWERWQVCGDVLRGQRNALLPPDFAQRVAQALAEDVAAPAAASGDTTRRPRLARWGGGAAIAASVALLAVFVTRQLPDPDVLPAPVQPQVAQVPAAVEQAPQLLADATPAVADVPAGTPRPAAPEASAAVAATVLAAAQAPRRVAERRNRAPSRPAAVSAQSAVAAVAATAVPDIVLPEAVANADELFALPEAAARPWPRTLLPAGNAFTVGDGRLPPSPAGFEPFLPQAAAAAPWMAPAPPVAVPAEAVQP